MNYAQILSGFLVGSHPQAIGDVERLRRESAITAVLNLQTDEDMRSVKLNWPPLEAHYRTCGVDLVRLPVKEEQIELREKLPECVRTLAGLITAGRTVYLHCTEGVGRSPTVAIGYLHWCLGWELDAAVRHMKRARQCSPHLEALQAGNVESHRTAPTEEGTWAATSEGLNHLSVGKPVHGRQGPLASRHAAVVTKALRGFGPASESLGIGRLSWRT